MHAAYIGLGSNLENPEQQVRRALATLESMRELGLQRASSLYRSAPVGHAEQPDFVNAVALLTTALAPEALLAVLLAIEKDFGRERSYRDAPRILDLDLLLYDTLQTDIPGLCLPHPRMHQRAFVLAPLVELAPDCIIPGLGAAAQWLARSATQRVDRLAGQ